MNLTRLTGAWRIAQPLDESADGLGVGAPAEPSPAAEPADDGGSLADHESDYVAPPKTEPLDDGSSVAASDRGPDGKFKRGERHRAASQQADIDDLPTINAHTKRIKDAEARLGADIVKQSGESERAFTLRRRAELLERQAKAPEPTPRRDEPAPRPAPVRVVAPTSAKFPDEADWLAKPENADKSYGEYLDERTAHTYAVLRENERREDAAREQSTRHRETLTKYLTDETALKAELPDYDAVLSTLGPDDVSLVVQHAVMQLGPRMAYHLAQNPAILRELTADTIVLPDNPAFAATVATTKRYLSTLLPVAEQRLSTSPTRTAAGPSGSAPASDRPLAPRPPNPGRTGSLHAADDPPGDGATLADHERFYVKKRA